jgi:hypothetical protein
MKYVGTSKTASHVLEASMVLNTLRFAEGLACHSRVVLYM